ncbi:MFS transporter [Sphaerisporangium corydalis]|uniref:MFS transporter n=1 Tax=Sphaerisporangium corydalis TaxID=1441875 RepID=A0ABV9EJU6_9ACTN
MSSLTAAPRATPGAAPAPVRPGRLSTGSAFYLQVSILVFFLAGSSAPTPLYSTYQTEWGFSPITVTVVFGVYAVAVLAALLVFGSLSDHVGRRPVLLAAVVLQAVTMLVFATAGGVPELLLARIVQGLSTGAAAGALGAGMLDLSKAKGTIANAVGPMAGTASGAIGSGLLVQFLPAPTHLVYLVLFAIFVLQAIGVALMPESVTRKPGALASLRPRFGLPPVVRRPLLIGVPALVAVWALAGFYGSLGPTVVRLVTGSGSLLLGGLALFAVAGTGGVSVLFLRTVPPRTVMLLGMVALVAGVGVTLLAISLPAGTAASTATLFAGMIVAGVGFGGGFQGALRTVIPLAEPHERAGVLSTAYVVCYLAMGLPAVVAGVLVVHGGGVLITAREYGVAIMVLAALALLGLARQGRRTPALAPDTR